MDSKVKLIAAAGGAIVALGVAGWVASSSLGWGRVVRSAGEAVRADRPPSDSARGSEDDGGDEPRRAARAAGPPAWADHEQDRPYSVSLDYPDRDDALPAFDEGADALALRAEQESELGTLGIVARRSLIETWRAFMRPLISGDADAFESAVAMLGGDIGDRDDADGPGSTAAALHQQLSGYLAGARFELDSAEIIDRDPGPAGAIPLAPPTIANATARPTDRPRRGIQVMVEAARIVDDQTSKASVRRSMSIPLAPVFPKAAELARNGARTVEVWAPAKMATATGSSADIGPSAYFVYDPAAGKWQPVAMRVSLVSDAASERLGTMMRRGPRGSD